MKFVKVIGILILFSFNVAFCETLVIKVLDFENKPLKVAHLLILNINDTTVVRKYEIKNGEIKFVFSEGGIYRLRITGINHKSLTIPIFFQGANKAINISLKLEPISFTKIPDKIPVIGNFNDWNFEKPLYLEKKSDKLFTLKFENFMKLEKLQYQIIVDDTIKGEPSQRSVNGLVADRFFLDAGNEDYVSEIDLKNKNQIEIPFDISKYPIYKVPSQVICDDSEYGEFYKVYEKIILLRKNFEKEKQLLEKDKNNLASLLDKLTFTKLKLIYSNFLQELENLYKTSKNLMSQKLIAIEYLSNASHLVALKMQPFLKVIYKLDVNQNALKRMLSTVEPNSPLWGYNDFYILPVNGVTAILLYFKEKFYQNYLNDMILSNPIKEVQLDALETAIEICFDILKDKQRGNYFLQTLMANFPNTNSAIYAERKYGNISKVRVGEKLPNFEINLIGDKENLTKISINKFYGKYLLVDFWATWCGPCVAEFPFLQEAYDKYKSKGFEILSISFDNDMNKVLNYISQKNLSWHFAIEPKGFESDVAKKLDIFAIPFPILLSPEGKVLAKGSELRGRRLLETLSKNLK